MKKYKYLYDPTISYEENYKNGPRVTTYKKNLIREKLKYELFGYKIDLPFGIPAGPLLNKKFVHVAWNLGFSIATYKTVRSHLFPSHPFPNVVRVKSNSDRVLPGDTVLGILNLTRINIFKDGITNSFGVPSQSPEVWQKDVKQTLKKMPRGKILILSFMGTKFENTTHKEYVDDFAKACSLANETGAPILEVNLSCPNFGKEGLICNDLNMSTQILEAIAKKKGNSPLIVKISYFPRDKQNVLEDFLERVNKYANGVSAINTISANVVDKNGKQLLPGSPVRFVSGICGAKIKWAGLEMAKRIMDIREKRGWKDLAVIGVGGITTTQDFKSYMSLGVDAALSATGAMWQPGLASRIHREII